jgi:hypothetical protein
MQIQEKFKIKTIQERNSKSKQFNHEGHEGHEERRKQKGISSVSSNADRLYWCLSFFVSFVVEIRI